MQKINKALYNSDLFLKKPLKEIEDILSSIQYHVKKYEQEELIFRMGQPTKYIGIILKGSIEIQKNLASGNIITIFEKNQGKLFGEGSVFSKSDTYPCNIFSKSKSTILFITKKNMLNLIFHDLTLLENFLRSISNRVLLLNLKTELLSYSSIQKKIAFSLLYLMDDYSCNNVITLPYSKKKWAEYLNVSRTSLFRELKEICDQKIIYINNKTITISNKNTLENLLNF